MRVLAFRKRLTEYQNERRDCMQKEIMNNDNTQEVNNESPAKKCQEVI